ncbi:hypothetical protein C2S52_010922 [Perilla frutescens var. hirtella]|nr:hypothetical protein C2S52_010922 [Perilla frutescens var. hirtella]KAH6817736.1 hypothetical protein C2S51_001339 [Perilla frutescens var. frutescens]
MNKTWMSANRLSDEYEKGVESFLQFAEQNVKDSRLISCGHAPRQPDSKQCGFYVLRFMKEIIEELQQNGSISVRSLFKKEKYLPGEIDDVRVEWANCVLQHI